MTSPDKADGVLRAVRDGSLDGGSVHSPSHTSSPSDRKTQEARMSWSKKVKIALAGLAAVVATGTTAYIADQQGWIDIPGINQTIDNGAQPFDIDKLDTVQQVVIDGINAHPATEDEIRSTINSPKLEIDLNNIKTVTDLPKVSILLSIDMQKAGKVKVWRPETSKFLNGKMSSAHTVLMLSPENANVPFGPAVLKGINTDAAEIFLMTPSKIGEELRFNKWYVKSNLGNNKYVIAEMTSTNPVAGTDIVKKAPIIDPNKPNGSYIEDIIQQKGQPVNIVENPTLIKTLLPNNDIGIVFWYIDANTGTTTILNPQNENGNLSYSVPN